MAKLGEGEGQVNLIAWAGYAEDGSTDPKVDWVTPFEKQTGCQVNVKIGNTSDEMVTLMRTGQYDGVSASGDATLRLIAGGDVAPVNTDLVPNYADVFDGLKNQPWNSVDGQMYGIPHGRGANLLMWRSDKVTTPLDSWSAVFDQGSHVQGQGHRLRQPDLHRRRGAVPEGDQARPRRSQPVRARRQAVRGRGRPAQDSSARTSASTGRTTPRSRRRSPAATRWSARPGRSSPTCSTPTRCQVKTTLPKEGATGLVGHLDDLVQGQAPELHVHVDGPDHLAEGQRRGGGVVRRGAGEREVVRGDRRQEPLQDLPRRRRGLLRQGLLLDDAAQGSAATTAGRSARTTPSGSRPGRRSRAKRTPLRGATGAVCSSALLLAGRWAGSASPTWARSPCCSSRRSGSSTTSPARSSSSSTLDNFQTLWDERRLPRRSPCARSGSPPLVTVTDALLAFPIAFFMAKVASRRVRGAAGGRRS